LLASVRTEPKDYKQREILNTLRVFMFDSRTCSRKTAWHKTCFHGGPLGVLHFLNPGGQAMKSPTLTIAAFLSAIALVIAATAFAQQVSQPAANPNNTISNATPDAAIRTAANSNSSVSQLDNKTSGTTVRASTLIKANLKNANDESVGEIKDLVIDTASGKVRYAAVTYGGFLGVGSKLFAVPFEAFHVRQNTSALKPGDYVLSLDVTKEQLNGAQGFDNNQWPDFANTSFTQELDRRYKVDRSQTLR
jgi:sporulation protein YlmC with PRC-barrel domain